MTTYYLWLSLPLLSLILCPTKEQINKELRTKETISLQQIKEVKNDTTQLIKNQLTCFIHKKRLSLHRMVKHLYIIAGCNGDGKTTASMTILPKTLLVKEFVNADEIAKGLSPLNPEGAAIEAGRLMLQRIDYLLSKEESFSIETTLATRSYIKLIEKAHQRGFIVNLLFFWLPSPELASIRVTERVRNGGHNIPKDIIYRRYLVVP